MRIGDLAAIILLAFASSSALAEDCAVCDTEIVLTSLLAKCFLGKTASMLDEMQAKNLPFHLVSLGDCEAVPGNHRGSDGKADSSRLILSWSDIRSARIGTQPIATPTFILDRTAIICLFELIKKEPTGFDPARAFRPAEMCAQ